MKFISVAAFEIDSRNSNDYQNMLEALYKYAELDLENEEIKNFIEEDNITSIFEECQINVCQKGIEYYVEWNYDYDLDHFYFYVYRILLNNDKELEAYIKVCEKYFEEVFDELL